jgi:DNA-binding HxlR family transcriptional regulator
MYTQQDCNSFIKPTRDVLEIINGKWRLPILISLAFGNKRFNELEKDIPGITPKMLSKDLQELEINELIIRKVHENNHQNVEYALTTHGKTLFDVTEAIRDWGNKHREKLFGRSKTDFTSNESKLQKS